MLKNIIIQYLFGISLALLTTPIVKVTLSLLPDIGWHFLTVIYLIIFFLQISFYFLTTNFNFGWTALSFTLNFLLWVLELVVLEKNFQGSFIYNDNIYIFIISGIFWVTNKLIIDKLFELNKSIHRKKSIINI